MDEKKSKTIKWLSRYKNITLRIRSLKEQILTTEEMATSVTTNYKKDGGQGKGGQADKVGTLALKLVELQNELQNEHQNLVDTELQIRKTINCVQDDLYKTILEERYINCKLWYQVSAAINFSEQHTKGYLLDKALTEVGNFIE